MSVTLTALTNAVPVRTDEDYGLVWWVHFDNQQDYNKGLINDTNYDVDDYKEFNVGNWTYYNNFVEWLLVTFPNIKPFEFALQTYAINSAFCNQIYQALAANMHLIDSYKHMADYHKTYLDLHAAFKFTGTRGLVIFE